MIKLAEFVLIIGILILAAGAIINAIEDDCVVQQEAGLCY